MPAKKKVRPTKKCERAHLLKERRRIRRKLRAKQAAKASASSRPTKSHPHRKSSALRQRGQA